MTQHDTNYVIELQIPNQLKHFSYRFRRIVDQIPIPTSHVESTENKNTRCAWAGGTGASFPDFCDNCQFYVIYCVYSC